MTRRRQRRVRILANRERRMDATHQPWANFNAAKLLGLRGRAHRRQKRFWDLAFANIERNLGERWDLRMMEMDAVIGPGLYWFGPDGAIRLGSAGA